MNDLPDRQTDVPAETTAQRALPMWCLWLFILAGSVALAYLWQPTKGPESLARLQAKIQTAVSKGDAKEKERLRRILLAAQEEQLGPEHLETLETLTALAKTLHARGSYREAESLYRRVLEVKQRKLGTEHPGTLASMSDLAHLLNQDDRTRASAETLLRRALEGRERVLGPEHLDTLATLSQLANLLAIKGDPAAAVAMEERVWRGFEAKLGAKHPQTVMAAKSLEKYRSSLAVDPSK